MEIKTSNVFVLQGQGTAAPPQTNQNAPVLSRQDIQKFKDQVRQTVRTQIAGATQDGSPSPTPAPSGRPPFVIRGPDGTETVISVPPNFDARNVIPPQAVDISVAFFMMVAAIIIGLPLARAFGRRMDRGAGKATVPTEVSSQLAQLNQAVDAIALEVERISEGQRYTTRLLSEQRDQRQQTLPTPSGK
jgi:hypothetical protein